MVRAYSVYSSCPICARCNISTLAMLKLLGLQSYSGNCPFGSCDHILGDEHLGTHFLLIHTEPLALSDCELALKCLSDDIFTHGQALYELFLCPDYVLAECVALWGEPEQAVHGTKERRAAASSGMKGKRATM